MVAQPAHGLHYFGYSGLVVGAEKGVSVGHDYVLSLVRKQFGELLCRRHYARRKLDVAPVIVAYDTRLHVLSAAVGRRVIVAYEAYGGHVFLHVRLQRGVDVAHVVHLHVVKALVFQLVAQVFGEYKLLRRARHGVAFLGRLCVETHILQKSFNNVHNVISVFIYAIRTWQLPSKGKDTDFISFNAP